MPATPFPPYPYAYAYTTHIASVCPLHCSLYNPAYTPPLLFFTPCTPPLTPLYSMHSLHLLTLYAALHYTLLTPPSTGRAAAAGCPRKGAQQRLPELAGKRPGRRPASVRRQAGRSVWDKPASVSGAARLLAREGCWQASRRLVGHAAQMLRERRFWRCCRQASRSKLAARLGRSYG